MVYRAVELNVLALLLQKKIITHEKLYVVRAKSWDSTYAPIPGYRDPIFKTNAEDASGWYDKRTGLYHILFNNKFKNAVW